MKVANHIANLRTNNQYLEQAKNESSKALDNISARRAISGADSSNLVISDSLKSQSSVLEQGIANANDAIAILQIADSALENLTKSADRLNELSVAMNSATLNSDQKAMLAREANILTKTMQDSVYQSDFNGKSVFSGEMSFMTGSGMQSLNLSAPNFDDVSVNNKQSVENFVSNINALRSRIGGAQNAIVSGINASVSSHISLSSAQSDMLNDDISKNVSGVKASDMKISASILAQVHNATNLQSQINRLLS